MGLPLPRSLACLVLWPWSSVPSVVMGKPVEAGGMDAHGSLLSWLGEHGVLVHGGIAYEPIGDAGLWGVVAKAPIQRDEVLLSVPKSMIFPLDLDAESSPDVAPEVLQSIPDNIFGSQVPAVQLARFLGGIGDPEITAKFQVYIDKLASLASWRAIPEFAVALEPSPLLSAEVYAERWARREIGVGDADGASLNRTLYLHANFILWSRLHGTDAAEGRALVPGADLFNHNPRAKATWAYVKASDAFRVTARESVGEGAEITVSYGDDRSNEGMMNHYGFTQPPYWEPFYTFQLFYEEGPDGAILPPEPEVGMGPKTKVFNMKTPIIHEGRGPPLPSDEYFMFFQDHPSSWERGLQSHLEFHLRRYEADASLAPLIDTWRSNRKENPATVVWWTSLPSCRSEWYEPGDELDCSEERDLSAELAGGSFVQECALRVKMSEYVALIAYLEMLDILRERRKWRDCLLSASAMADIVKKGVPQWKHEEL